MHYLSHGCGRCSLTEGSAPGTVLFFRVPLVMFSGHVRFLFCPFYSRQLSAANCEKAEIFRFLPWRYSNIASANLRCGFGVSHLALCVVWKLHDFEFTRKCVKRKLASDAAIAAAQLASLGHANCM